MQALKALRLFAWLNLLVGLFGMVGELFLGVGGPITQLALVFLILMQAMNWFVLFHVIIPIVQNLIEIRDKRE